MGGVIGLTLTACSEDYLQSETKQLNKVVPGTDPKAARALGDIKPYTSVNGYVSPWDINNLVPVKYYFNCYLSWDNIYVRITPYIGLAYWVGADDGVYHSSTGVFNLTTGMFPNLYGSGHEYGNYIAANPIVLDVNNSSTHELAIFSDWVTQGLNDHCPVVPNVYQYSYNPDPIYFDLVNNQQVRPNSLGVADITPPPPSATPQEVDLLKDYGKVMYYKIEFGRDPHTYNDVFYALALEDNSNQSNWGSMGLTDTFGGDLHWHNGYREIVIDVNSPILNANAAFVKSTIPFTSSFGVDFKITTSYGYFVTLKVEQN